MVLIKEDMRGEKIERDMALPPGPDLPTMIPGGVFDANERLKSGEFIYLSWDKRKPYKIQARSHQVDKICIAIPAAAAGGISEDATARMTKSLTQPSNFSSLPRRSSCAQMRWSTFPDSMGLQIGASCFMGSTESKPFTFSSDQHRFMYVYTFDQIFLTVNPEEVSSPADLFSDASGLIGDALYVQEVTYGRRLYVIMESQYDLQKTASELNGSLEWIVVCARLQRDTLAREASQFLTIRSQSQDGRTATITDFTTLQATVDHYFRSPCADNPIVPLSYKVCDLQGTPVCLRVEAHLEGRQRLEKRTPLFIQHPSKPAGQGRVGLRTTKRMRAS